MTRRTAIDDGKRIIVSTLQKFPVIFKDVKSVEGKRFAIVVDEAHSSQTGQSAAKLKIALADLREAVAEYEAETGKKIDKDDLDSPETQLALMMCTHGKHNAAEKRFLPTVPHLFDAAGDRGRVHP